MSNLSFDDLLKRVTPLKILKRDVPVSEGIRVLQIVGEALHKPSKTIDMPLNQIDVDWFTLAPVYAICKFPFDLVSDFAQTKWGEGCKHAAYLTETPVTEDIAGWETTIEAMDSASMGYFKRFVAESAFCRKIDEKPKAFFIKCSQIQVKDFKFNSFYTLNVFTPEGQRMSMDAFADEVGKVKFRHQQVGNIFADNAAKLYDFYRK